MTGMSLPLDFRCPRCGAIPGTRCTNQTTPHTARPHEERAQLAATRNRMTWWQR